MRLNDAILRSGRDPEHLGLGSPSQPRDIGRVGLDLAPAGQPAQACDNNGARAGEPVGELFFGLLLGAERSGKDVPGAPRAGDSSRAAVRGVCPYGGEFQRVLGSGVVQKAYGPTLSRLF